MDFIGVGGDDDKEPYGPGKHAEGPGTEYDCAGNKKKIPRTLPPTQAGEVAWVVMVDDIGAGDERAEDGCVFASVGVFDPMDEAGDKVGQQDGGQNFKKNEWEGLHEDGPS